jgi:hypothetical protein
LAAFLGVSWVIVPAREFSFQPNITKKGDHADRPFERINDLRLRWSISAAPTTAAFALGCPVASFAVRGLHA